MHAEPPALHIADVLASSAHAQEAAPAIRHECRAARRLGQVRVALVQVRSSLAGACLAPHCSPRVGSTRDCACARTPCATSDKAPKHGPARARCGARRNAREAEERAQLLQRRNGTAADGGGEVAIEMESLARETRTLHEADSSLDMLQAHGAAVLEALSSQSATLRSSRMKLRAVFDTLGLSNSLLRLIERRQLADKALLWGGMLLTAALLYVLLRWTRA